MASKKLKLEVELETAKAKRQAKELEQTGGSTSSGGAPGTSLPTASSRAARQISELGNAAQGARVNMKEVTRAFTGMAVGMAANYAAKSMKPGAARDAVEYGGAAMTGASMGMIAGPIGAAVGALGGILKTYLDKEVSKAQATADFMRGEHDYAEGRAWKATIDNLTEVGDHFENLTKNIDETAKLLEHYRKVEHDLVEKTKQFRAKGDETNAKLEEGYLAVNRSRQESLEGILKNLERQRKTRENMPEYRGGITGTDALAKLGAGEAEGGAPGTSRPTIKTRSAGFNFGFSVPSVSRKFSTMTFGTPTGGAAEAAIKTATERSAKLDEEMAKTLKEIEKNTKGGEAWQ